MKKWFIAFAAGAVVIGCGGGSGLSSLTGGTTGTGGSTGGGRTVPTPNLGSFAQVQLLYLSGQGRRAPGSQIAVIDNIRLFNDAVDYYPKDQQGSGSPLRIQLDHYTANQFLFDVPLSIGGPSKTFTQFPLEIAQIDEEQGGSFQTVYSGPPVLISPFFDMNMVLFPGRQTTMQVVLNDQTLKFDPVDGVVFDRAQFETDNYSPVNNKLNAFLSDMFSFDLTAMAPADRPLLSSGQRADMALFSGDSIGISQGYDVDGSFDMLSPVVIDTGVITKPTVIGGRNAPGIYTVMEPDPQDPFGNAKLVALEGTYRQYTEVLQNLSDFAMIAIPKTRSTTTHQVVLINRNANGAITAMWQGVVDFNGTSTGDLRLYSLDQLPDATAQPKALGKVSFNRVNGVVKTGTFSMTVTPTNYPFPKSGGFMVLR